MSQDTFNKIYTLLLTVYFMAMYTTAWLMGKPLDLVTLAAFLIPSGVHGFHLVTQGMAERLSIKSDAAKEIAKNGAVQ